MILLALGLCWLSYDYFFSAKCIDIPVRDRSIFTEFCHFFEHQITAVTLLFSGGYFIYIVFCEKTKQRISNALFLICHQELGSSDCRCGFAAASSFLFTKKRIRTKVALCHPWHRQIPYILYIKISPYYCLETPALFTKLTAAQIRHPWLNYAFRDVLSLHSPI